MPNLARNKLCTGCLACKDTCVKQAISVIQKDGLTYIEVNPEICVNCNACEQACPIVTPVPKNEVQKMHAYGGWAKDEKTRVAGASGGAFAGIAQSFIKEHTGNVAVYGASLVNNLVSHERITMLEEIPILMNSKYIQSNTEGIFKKVRKDLSNNIWVLFSGTPCQIAALYGYLGKKRNEKHLLTVEVVCHGIPGKEALDIHLERFHSPKIFSFRNKEEGQYWNKSQCTTIERDGKPYRFQRDEDVFYKIFSGWLLDRRSCSNCQYSSINRVADITLADFWGDVRDQNEYEKGVNVIFANNDKGNIVIRQATELITYETTLTAAISGNSNMYNGFKYIQYHPFVLWPEFCRKTFPRSLWLAIIENRMPWKLLWTPYKILTQQHAKRIRKQIRKQYGI